MAESVGRVKTEIGVTLFQNIDFYKIECNEQDFDRAVRGYGLESRFAGSLTDFILLSESDRVILTRL